MNPTIAIERGTLHDPDRPDWDGQGRRPISWVLWRPDPMPAALSVVLLSHGTGGRADGLAWLAEGLCRAGHAVLGVNHHGNTAIEPYRAEGFLCCWERPRDLTVILDRHLSAGPIAGRIDPDRIYAAGFSLGGYSVVALAGARTDMARFRTFAADHPDVGNGPREFPDIGDRVEGLLARSPVFRSAWERAGADYRDSRVAAVFAMAPAPTVRGFTDESLTSVCIPVSILTGEADREAPFVSCSQWLAARLRHGQLESAGRDVGHYVFIDTDDPALKADEPELFLDPPGIDRKAVQRRALETATRLFASSAREVTPGPEP